MIVGLGETGLSCARYLSTRKTPFAVMDDSPAPRLLPALRALGGDIPFTAVDGKMLLEAEQIIVSPGVPLSRPELRAAKKAGVELTGDVALFGGLTDVPFAAITGTNGKSTVTALFTHLAQGQRRVAMGGNIGTPCLDLLSGDPVDLYVIEVSSYQLELASALPASTAVVLNLFPDHLDRYESVSEYYRTKARVYANCTTAVVNRDLNYDFDIPAKVPKVIYGVGAPESSEELGVRDGKIVLGDEPLVCVKTLPMPGVHNVSNTLAALAMGIALDLDVQCMLDDLPRFRGLPHRCEFVGETAGVRYYNDSKATNVGATIAAVESLAERQNVIIILGGLGKDADFEPLGRAVGDLARRAIVFGRDRQLIGRALENRCEVDQCESLEEVVERARIVAEPGDIVLFSPACASQDMFIDYRARGDAFRVLVAGGSHGS